MKMKHSYQHLQGTLFLSEDKCFIVILSSFAINQCSEATIKSPLLLAIMQIDFFDVSLSRKDVIM